MGRLGTNGITIDDKSYDGICKIRDKLGMISVPETIRFLIREFKKKEQK